MTEEYKPFFRKRQVFYVIVLIGLIIFTVTQNPTKDFTAKCQELGFDGWTYEISYSGQCYKNVHYDDGTVGREYSKGKLP